MPTKKYPYKKNNLDKDDLEDFLQLVKMCEILLDEFITKYKIVKKTYTVGDREFTKYRVIKNES